MMCATLVSARRTEGMSPLLSRALPTEGVFDTDEVICRTTGGSGGTQTTVTSVSQLQSAVSASGKGIVLVSGKISGAAKVTVGSDKTIIGLPGSCEFLSSLILLSHTHIVKEGH